MSRPASAGGVQRRRVGGASSPDRPPPRHGRPNSGRRSASRHALPVPNGLNTSNPSVSSSSSSSLLAKQQQGSLHGNVYTPFLPQATDTSTELHALRARVRTLEAVNEELLHAKSEFSFLTPYEHARTSRYESPGSFGEIGAERLRKMEETLMRYVKQLAEARGELAELSGQLGGAGSLRESHARHRDAVDAELERARHDREKLMSQIETLKARVQRIDRDREASGQAAAASSAECKRLTDLLGDATAEKQALAERGAALKKRVDDLRAAEKRRERQVQNLESELRTTKDALVREITASGELRTKLDSTSKQGRRADKDRTEIEAARARAEQEASDLRGRLARAEKDLSLERDRTRRLGEELDAQADAQAVLRADLASMAARSAATGDETRHAAGEMVAQAREECERATKERVARARAECERAARETVAEARAECESHRARADRAEQESRDLKLRCEALERERETAGGKRAAEAEKELHLAREESLRLRRESGAREAEIAALRRDLDAAESKQSERLAAARKEAAEARDAAERARAEFEELSGMHREAEEELRGYRGSTIDPREHEALRKELAASTKREADLRARVVELEQILEEERAEWERERSGGGRY